MSVDPSIDRNARRISHSPDARLMAKAAPQPGDSGWIEGYAAVWGNVDGAGEVMDKGCFARSIGEVVGAGKVKLMSMHYRDGGDALQCIGTITKAREDDYGLWIHADLSSVAAAQDIRTKVLEGHIKSLSVGYRPIKWATRNVDGVAIVAHTECALGEVTVTVKPANELALITAAKSRREGGNLPAQILADLNAKKARLKMLDL